MPRMHLLLKWLLHRVSRETHFLYLSSWDPLEKQMVSHAFLCRAMFFYTFKGIRSYSGFESEIRWTSLWEEFFAPERLLSRESTSSISNVLLFMQRKCERLWTLHLKAREIFLCKTTPRVQSRVTLWYSRRHVVSDREHQRRWLIFSREDFLKREMLFHSLLLAWKTIAWKDNRSYTKHCSSKSLPFAVMLFLLYSVHSESFTLTFLPYPYSRRAVIPVSLESCKAE